MITIRMETERCKLTVEGHAQPEESEQYKEICAAASALAQAMVFALTRCSDGALMSGMDYRPVVGDLSARIYPTEGNEKQVKRVMTEYGYGMELLAKSHPKSVEMIWDGEKIIPDKEMRGK